MAEKIITTNLRVSRGYSARVFFVLIVMVGSIARAQPISISLVDSSASILQVDSVNWNEAWIEVSGSAPASPLLSKNDLRVLCRGRVARVLSVDSIATRFRTRLALSFVLDNSSSMFHSYDTLTRYCDSILDDQPTGLIAQAVTFDNRDRNPWELYTPERSTFLAQSNESQFTSDRDSLRTFWHFYDTVRTEFTPLYDAIATAVANINNRREHDSLPRSDVLLVITDGKDNASRTSVELLENLIASSKIRLFAINYRVEGEGRLPWLARKSGGEYFLAPDESSLKQILRSIGRDLTRFYHIRYRFSSLGPSSGTKE